MPRTLTDTEIARLLADGRLYRSTTTVRATRVSEDCDWTTKRGDVLHASAGDWWVIDGDERWAVSGPVFAKTYENVGGDRFRKHAEVTAVRVSESFALKTSEGIASGQPGDWLVRNPTGESWPVPADTFERRYVQS